MAAIEAEKALIGDSQAFQREYMLKSVGVNTAIIKPEWITYYDELPSQSYDYQRLFSAIGIDLAIVVSDTSDFTSMVSAHVYEIDDKVSIYILPNPINMRMEYPETVTTCERLSRSVFPGSRARLYIEEVGYQAALIQTLKNKSYHVVGFKPQGQDKASRLALTTPAIVDGTVLFPKTGAEDLIRQLVYFGSEHHDDLADAFAILILLALQDIEEMDDEPSFTVIGKVQLPYTGL
jgi:predicted phage terminase large subunit-like protein